MLGSMEKRGAVSISGIDPLFGYDFFIAVNNPVIREMEFEQFNEYYIQTTYLLKNGKDTEKSTDYPFLFQKKMARRQIL